jgi:PilZ domain
MRGRVRDAPKEPTRAQRFAIAMPLSYRRPGEPDWHEGKVENISRTGVLFNAKELMDESAPVEMTFQLPVEIGGAGAAQVFCAGKIVRTVLPPSSDQQPALAAQFRSYQFVPKGKMPGA